jgi:hypothetical protein
MKEDQALLQQLAGFLKQGDSLWRDFLSAEMLQVALELLDLFVEIRQKSPVFCRQIFFFAVQLRKQRTLQPLGRLDGRIVIGSHLRTQCRQLAQLKQGVQIDSCHHRDNDQAGQNQPPKNG